MVVDHLSRRLYTADRLNAILAASFSRRAEKAAEVDERAAALHREVSDTADKLKRLYRNVEDGVAELDDILRDRIASLKSDRERAQTALDRIRVQIAPPGTISPETVEEFGRIMRENIANGEIRFRKDYLRAVIDRIEVDDHTVRIVGQRDA